MCFLIEEDNLFEKHNTVWNKVTFDTKKNDGKPVYNKPFLKINIKML